MINNHFFYVILIIGDGMNDIRWGDITVDTEKKEEYLNSLSKQQLISFFKSQSLSYISLLNNDKIDEIIGEPAIQERLVSAGDKWLERSILLEKIFSKLNRSNVLHFLNDHMLELIRLGHLRHSFVLNLLASPNPYISYCLEETKFFELLLNDDSFIQLYDHMSEETVKCFFQYILKIDEEKNVGVFTNLNYRKDIETRISATAMFNHIISLINKGNSTNEKLINISQLLRNPKSNKDQPLKNKETIKNIIEEGIDVLTIGITNQSGEALEQNQLVTIRKNYTADHTYSH